jgi:hypothetical protein
MSIRNIKHADRCTACVTNERGQLQVAQSANQLVILLVALLWRGVYMQMLDSESSRILVGMMHHVAHIRRIWAIRSVR